MPSSAAPPPERDRYLELDLLRFCAAMAVLVYHYKSKYIETLGDRPELAAAIYSVTKFWYLGVDLFFLISGFVIFSSALGRTPFQFAVSRLTRIYPTFWVCMTISALVAIALQPRNEVTIGRWLANLTLLNRSVGISHIDGVYWSLEIELRFYGLVFLMLAVGWLRRYRVYLPIWLVLTASFAAFGQPFFMGWFISPEYSPYFIAGIVFFLARREGFGAFHVLMLAGAFPLAAYNAYWTVDSFARNVTVADRWIAMGLVAGLFGLFTLMALRRIPIDLRRATLVLALGGMTYPLYLLHNLIGKALFDRFVGAVPPLLLLVLITFGVMFLSWVIHAHLERRIADPFKGYLIGSASRLRERLAGWSRGRPGSTAEERARGGR